MVEENKEEIENTYIYNKIDILQSRINRLSIRKSHYSKEDYREAVELQNSYENY